MSTLIFQIFQTHTKYATFCQLTISPIEYLNQRESRIPLEHLLTQFLQLTELKLLKQALSISILTWFDSLLRRTIRKRDRLCNLALKYERETDWKNFRQTRNQVNNIKKNMHFPTIMTTLIPFR